MDTVLELLRDAGAAGVRLLLKDGALFGRPTAAVTPELRERIVALKPHLIEHLSRHAPVRRGPPKPKGEPVSGYSFHGPPATAPVTAQPAAPDPVVLPRHDQDTARTLFAAWDMHVGYAPMSVAGLIAYAAKHPGLEAALRTTVGSIELDRLAAYLPTLAGMTINDHQIVRDGESAWRLASMWSLNLTAKQAKTQEMFKTTEDWS